MIVRYGYYLPMQDMLCGENILAEKAKQNFDRLGLQKDVKGRYQGNKYDGCSVWQLDSGQVITRVCLQDFFSETFRVIVKDL